MDIMTITLICLIGSLILAIIGIPIAFALGFGAIVGVLWAMGPAPLIKLGIIPFSAFHGLNWTSLPLFIFMASIICETAIGSDIYDAANKWLSRIPGGLVLAGVWSQAALSAIQGSSGVGIITIGKVAIPEMEKLNYNRRFSMGALLVSGTLGPLIPPSISLIVYGLLAQQSISELFIAGLIPGVVLALMISGYAIIACTVRPEYAPRPAMVSWGERFRSITRVWPVVLVIVGVITGIYAGVVTITEAAGAAVLIILVIAIAFYKFRFGNLVRSLIEAATLTSMIGIMVIVVTMLTYLIDASGIVVAISHFITTSNLHPLVLVVMINITLLILGMFMDGLAIMMLAVPIFVPLITAAGLSPVWFGVLMVVNVEIALITPPQALNLYLMSSIFKEPVGGIIRGMVPFLAVLVIFLGVLILFPEVTLWLPGIMKTM